MQLSGVELSAIAKLAYNMAASDGHVDERETAILAAGFQYFGVSLEDAKPMLVAAALVDSNLAEGVISEMTMEQKYLVSAWLVCVVIADGRIAPGEIEYMRHLTVVCGLPNLNASEARERMAEEQRKRTSEHVQSGDSASTDGGGCMVPIALIISAVLGIGSIAGCGPSEPSNSEIATGMKRSFIQQTGAFSANLDAKAKKIGDGRWSVKMTAEKDGFQRTLNATAVMDKNGDIHYYTE